MGWKFSVLILVVILAAQIATGQNPPKNQASAEVTGNSASSISISRGGSATASARSVAGGPDSGATATATSDDETATSEAKEPKKEEKSQEKTEEGGEQVSRTVTDDKETEVKADGSSAASRSIVRGGGSAQAIAVSGPSGSGGEATAEDAKGEQEDSLFVPKLSDQEKKDEKKRVTKEKSPKKRSPAKSGGYSELDICSGLSKFLCCDDQDFLKNNGELLCGCWGIGNRPGSCQFKVLNKENPLVVEDISGFQQGTRCRCPVAGVEECSGFVKIDCCINGKDKQKCRCLFGDMCLYEKVSDKPLVWKDVGFGTGNCECT